MEPVSIITLVGVGLLMIERVLTIILKRVKKGKSKCPDCCEVSTEYNSNNKNESTGNPTPKIPKTREVQTNNSPKT
jgi:hypothetical protein